MKKILSIALVLVMMMSMMSVTAFAASGDMLIDSEADVATGVTNEVPYTEKIDVNVRLDSDGDGIPDIDDTDDGSNRVLVELTWTDMEFIYSKAWDGYAGETTSEWEETDQFISVMNRSTYEVTATFGYTQIDSDYNIEFSVREMPTDVEGETVVRTSNASFADNVLTLANPTTADLDKDEEGNNILPWGEIAVTLADGAKVPEVDSKEAVGTITVTIAATGFTPEVVSEIVFSNSSDNEFTVKRGEAIPISGTYNGYSVKVSSTLVLEGMTFDKDAQTLTFDMVGVYPPMIFVTTDLNYNGNGEAPITGEVELNITVVD